MDGGGVELSGDAQVSERVRKFTDFLDHVAENRTSTNHQEELRRLLNRSETRYIVSLDEIREFNRELWSGYVADRNQFLWDFSL
jgi:DNA replication licensing factor MCM3